MHTVVYNKDNPFFAKLTDRHLLSGSESLKQTFHFELNIGQSNLEYQCGDSIGIYAKNEPEVVEAILRNYKFDPLSIVYLPKTQTPITLQEALLSKCSLVGPTLNLLKWMLEYIQDEREKAILEDLINPDHSEKLKSYLLERHLIDLSEEFSSLKASPQEYVNQLRKLQPRLYSIASSPVSYPEHIHLTIDMVNYNSNNKIRKGIASSFLAERVNIHEPSVPIFITPSHFKLPTDLDANIIMVGPGTGIAPFRGFMQERKAKKSKGQAWLFFGAQSKKNDYLYEEEWAQLQNEGYLTHISLAFSRDQDHKIYVQDKMYEASALLWEWIQQGAYFYVCGDAKNMAKDVDNALHSIIQNKGNMTTEEAQTYVKNLKKLARYQRDVY